MKKTILFLLLLCFSSYAMAQQTAVSGKVTSREGGEPMIGVSVSVSGTTRGTITDVNGNFSINIAGESAVLVFDFVGYTQREVAVTAGQNNLQVVMDESLYVLDQVVAIGYGSAPRSDLSGASSTISESKLRGSVVTNIDQALAGRATGVTSVMTSGAPGSAVSIRIRGQATLNAGAEPLYVVDGVIWQGGETNPLQLGLALGNGRGSVSPLSTLNPSDIMSMEILKDASATAIYGAQGSNGVVLITTKRGRSGAATFSYEGMIGVKDQVRRLNMMDLREYAIFQNMIEETTGGQTGTPEYQDPSILGKGTSWQDAIFQSALTQQHTVSARGGTETVRYYVSGSVMDEEGTMIGTDFNRFSVRANLDADLKQWLKLGLNAMYSKTSENLTRAEGDEGVLTYSLQSPPDIPIYDAYGNWATVIKENYSRKNPIAFSILDKNHLERQKLNGNIFLEVTPIEGLTFHTELGYDIGLTNTENWQPTISLGAPAAGRATNSISLQMNHNFYWQVTNHITYAKQIGKHSFTAMLGQEAWESSWNWQRITGTNLPSDEIRNPSLADGTKTFGNGFGDSAMASIFTRETYNYDDRYLLTYTFRYDGSSNFGPNNRWAPFHSVAGSWRFSNETFFEPIKHIISDGKLRIGWGQTGNASIGGGHWNSSINAFPTGLGTAYRMGGFANPAIQWETQQQWNLGLDISLLNNRINLTIDMYDKTANDMLMRLQTPTYFGARGNGSSVLSAPYGNFGTINNKGLEIALNTRNIETSDFTWSSDISISFNKNKLVSLKGTDASALEGYGQWNDVISRSLIGGSLYEFFGYKTDGVYTSKDDIKNHLWGENFSPQPDVKDSFGGFNPTNTVFVGDIKYVDVSGPAGVPDGKITVEDRTGIGSPLPKFTFGFNNTFTYKNFDLTIFLNGSVGNKIFNNLNRTLTNMGWNSNQLQSATQFAKLIPIDANKLYPYINEFGQTINNWFDDIDNVQLENPDTKMSRGGRNIGYNNSETSDRYLEDGSYLRIRNIVLGYDLPKRWIEKANIDGLRVYANIQNLHTFTKYSGYDPEVGVNQQDSSGFTFGFDSGRYPAPRLISFGVNISF